MRKFIKGIIFVIGIVLFIQTMNAWQDFMYAKADDSLTYSGDTTNTDDATNTGDATNTDDATPDDQKTQDITITFDVENDKTLSEIKVMLNGEHITYDSSNLKSNVLTMSVSKTETQLIEFDHSEYYFEPAYIVLNENKPDLKENYKIKARKGSKKAEVEVEVTDQDGNAKTSFEHDETAYVSLKSNVPMNVMFYQLPKGQSTKLYEKPIKITANSEEDHIVSLGYTNVRYYPGQTPPTLEYDFSNVVFIKQEIHFKEKTNNSDPSDSPFVDQDGNKYEEKDVKLSIDDLKNISKYKKAISTYKEFKDIPESQISYFDISLKASNVEVQPTSNYSLVIPYPKGSDSKDEFVIYHFISGDVTNAENLNYLAKSDGLHVTVKSFSPFVIGWKEKAVTPPTPTDPKNPTPTNPNGNNAGTTIPNRSNIVSGVNTGDISNISLWLFVLIGSSSLIISQVYKKIRS